MASIEKRYFPLPGDFFILRKTLANPSEKINYLRRGKTPGTCRGALAKDDWRAS
jgi:hypothetical protein